MLKQYFDPYIQRRIDTTVWDEIEKRALSESDVELREASKTPASMPWFLLESGVQLSQMNITEDESSEEDINIQIDTRSDVSTFASKVTEKRNRKYKLNNPEVGVEDDVSDLTTKSQDTKLTKMQESITNMEGKLAATVEENEKLQKRLNETMSELAKKKLSPESLT